MPMSIIYSKFTIGVWSTCRRMVRLLLNNKLERIWKEAVIALSVCHPDIGLVELRKTSEISWLISEFTKH
jgi:hypothetical protein